MSTILITTAGAADANSFADLAYADAYFANTQREATWLAIGDDNARERALLDAMLVLEGLDWIGGRSSGDQALSWPRMLLQRGRLQYTYFGSSMLVDYRGRYWPANEVPNQIRNAQCELALLVAQDASWVEGTFDVTSIRTGIVQLGINGGADAGSVLGSRVWLWLDGFLLSGSGVIRLVKS